jgi:hypothetical protein
LCVPLFDDAFLSRFFPKRFRSPEDSVQVRRPISRLVHSVHHVAIAVVAVLILSANYVLMGQLMPEQFSPPRIVSSLSQQITPYGIVNPYGLFVNMTTTRAEIIVEGSNDGKTWLPYEFKYKPGDVNRTPEWVAPFQPRLDWQMWFAALDQYGSYTWFDTLMTRLLQGTPEVLALLAKNPFPGTPPHYVRAELYDYHYTDAATRQATGAWWTRTQTGEYYPQKSLDNP